MGFQRILLPLAVVPLLWAGTELDDRLKTVEKRYNRARTLEVLFQESYTAPGRPRRTESGALRLLKPGKMRWDYTSPQGKLFLSDGKSLWLYTPNNHRVEKIKLKESEDMRAPLAFLLGKLDFSKEFRNIEARPEGADLLVTAEPASENLPYTRVEFVITPDSEIRRVKVTGYDQSVLDFRFDQEKLNPPLDAKLFQFRMPPGAELAEEAQ